MKRALVLAVLVWMGCRTTPEGDGEPRVSKLVEAEPVGRYYTVQAGDTLFEIAARFDLPVEEIAEVNGVAKPEELAVGQILFLPEDDPLALPAKEAPKPRPKPVPISLEEGRLAWPLEGGVLLREFAPTLEVPFDGLEIAAPAGTEVRAAATGQVLYAGNEGTTHGTMIVLRHEGELTTVYAHLDALLVEAGETVVAGQAIAKVGSSGRTPTPRLHFQVRLGRTPVDPLSRLPEP